MTLKRIESGKGRVCISAVYNSGRKATVRVHLRNPELIHISIDTDPIRPYQSAVDGYLHLEDTVGAVDKTTFSDWPAMLAILEAEADSQRKAVAAINAAYFAKKLIVISDNNEVAERLIKSRRSARQLITDIWRAATDSTDIFGFSGFAKPSIRERFARVRAAIRPVMRREEFIRPLSAAHLGGTWQKFSPDGWVEELRRVSDQPIYLA